MHFKTGERKWDETKWGRSIDRKTFLSFFALVPYTRKSLNPFQKEVVRDDPNQLSFPWLCFTLTLWLISKSKFWRDSRYLFSCMVSCNTHSLFTANLEVRNAHLPELNGYSQGKQEPSNKAVTPYNGINRVSESITTTSNIGMFILTLVSTVNNLSWSLSFAAFCPAVHRFFVRQLVKNLFK